MNFSLASTALCLGLSVASFPAQTDPGAAATFVAADPSTVNADELLKAFTPDKPGLQVVVARGGKILYERYLGSADLEHAVPVTAATRFHVASVSKQFTAFAALQLIGTGKIDPDADIHVYLPELADYGRKITVSDLAHHISGIRDQWELLILSGTSIESLITQKAILAMAASQKGLNFAPGTDLKYSNLGYSLLAEIVARRSGMSFRKYLTENIFKPLGLDETFVYDDASELVRDRAMSYVLTPDMGVKLSRLNYSNYGATSLHTTARDLLKWSREILHPGVFDPALIKAFEQPGILHDGTRTNYAWGVMLEPIAGRTSVSHGGADAGFRSFIASFPNSDASIVVLSNGAADVLKLTAGLANIFLPAESPPPVAVPLSPALLEKLPGVYSSGWAPAVELSTKDGKLYLGLHAAKGAGLRELLVGTDGLLFDPDRPSAGFTLRADGTLVERQFIGGLPLEYKRVVLARPSAAELASLAGRYHSDELDVTYEIKPSDGGITLLSLRNPPMEMAPAETDVFELPLARLSVIRNPAGLVTAIEFSTGRLRHIKLIRTADAARRP